MSDDAETESRMVENYESFFARLRPLFAPSVIRKIELAYILAKHAHRAQKRQEVDEHGDPVRYFEHIRRTALIGIDEADVVRFDTICSCILHDAFEDTRLTPEIVEDCFGSDLCGIVKVVSKTPKEGFLDRFYSSRDWRPYFVKACNRYDNLRSLDQTTPTFRARQVAETRDHYFRLFDRMVVLTPEEYRDGTRRLRDEISDLTHRLEQQGHREFLR